MNAEYFEQSVDSAIEALEKIRNSLAGGDSCRQNHIDPAVLTTIFDINDLEGKIRRLKENSKEEFMKRWKENAHEVLEDMRCERTIKNMLFDFALDLHKAEVALFPEKSTFADINQFICFWMKENFNRKPDGTIARDIPPIAGIRHGFITER